MSKKSTLEEAYFHISNGGLTLKVVERIDHRDRKIYEPYKPGETIAEMKKRHDTPLGVVKLTNRRWYMEVKLNSYGGGVSFKFPLVPLIVGWLVEVLPRVHGHMMMPQTEPTDGIEHAFHDTRYAYVKHHEGREVDYKWPHKSESQSEDCSSDQQEPPAKSV
jgi:hypothetical protein